MTWGIEEAFNLPIGNLWGVGHRYAGKLKKYGITTAAQLRDANDDWINSVMTVNGLRLVHELRGFPCRMLKISPPPQKAIVSAPSFGRMVPYQKTIIEALTTHLARAAEKLRKQDSLCGTLTVFLHTNRFRRTPGNGQLSKQYYNSRTIELPHPTSSTTELIYYSETALKSIFQFGYNYQKVGLILSNFVPFDYRRKGVFVEGPDERLLKLSGIVNKLNYRHGRDFVRLASQTGKPDWVHRREHLSRCYTTSWKDILTAH
ncbi:DinB/UmuC family translesion DNA polymerase [Spirosoma aerophilum]